MEVLMVLRNFGLTGEVIRLAAGTRSPLRLTLTNPVDTHAILFLSRMGLFS